MATTTRGLIRVGTLDELRARGSMVVTSPPFLSDLSRVSMSYASSDLSVDGDGAKSIYG